MIVWELQKGSADSCFISCRGVLMWQYSNILNDPAMTRVNIVGLSLNLGYLICYYIYSENKVSLAVIFSYTFLLPVVFAIWSVYNKCVMVLSCQDKWVSVMLCHVHLSAWNVCIKTFLHVELHPYLITHLLLAFSLKEIMLK
jgi:hypothetical protein